MASKAKAFTPPLFYDLAIRSYQAGIRLASLWNAKAGRWVAGRRGVWAKIEKEASALEGPVCWMHCSSAGEFEQGKPVLDALKAARPEVRVVVTFWSPSGFEVHSANPALDAVWYLPGDSRTESRRLFEVFKPDFGVFVKYDLWLNTLSAAQKAGVPLYLVSAHFRADQIFFRQNPVAGWFRRGLNLFEEIFCQDEQSIRRLEEIGVKASLAPDTRFDRVLSIKENLDSAELSGVKQKQLEQIEAFSSGHQTMVVGSSWLADEELLAEWASSKLPSDWKLILVPHETDEAHLGKLGALLDRIKLEYGRLSSQSKVPGQILIVDAHGLLSRIYRLADLAYVGGGFGEAVHNTLEPAAYGIPVIFGPNNSKFLEIQGLKQSGAGIEIRSQEDLNGTLDLLISDDNKRRALGAIAGSFVRDRSGGTETIVKSLLPHLPQSS